MMKPPAKFYLNWCMTMGFGPESY